MQTDTQKAGRSSEKFIRSNEGPVALDVLAACRRAVLDLGLTNSIQPQPVSILRTLLSFHPGVGGVVPLVRASELLHLGAPLLGRHLAYFPRRAGDGPPAVAGVVESMRADELVTVGLHLGTRFHAGGCLDPLIQDPAVGGVIPVM